MFGYYKFHHPEMTSLILFMYLFLLFSMQITHTHTNAYTDDVNSILVL